MSSLISRRALLCGAAGLLAAPRLARAGIIVPPPTAQSIRAVLKPTSALTTLRRTAGVARYNNPRVNGVMATPPAITSSATATPGLTNSYTWSGSKGGVFNFYGGVGASSAGYRSTQSTTVSGSRNNQTARIEVDVDAVKVSFAFFGLTTGDTFRFIVNGQYASLAATAPGLSGLQYLTLDFTSAGGRANRNIIIESTALFYSANVAVTEGVYKPGGDILNIAVIGDSYTAGAGATLAMNGYAAVLGDMLGARNIINLGIGSTGWLATASGTQSTARGRIPDAQFVTPDILFVCMGHNDTIYTGPQITTEVGLFLAALRATPGLATLPVFIFGVFSGNIANATASVTENAMLSAVTAFGDPNIFFIPVTTDANGSWFTGSGATTNIKGDGNCDAYIGSDLVHPIDSGHLFLGSRCADAVIRAVQTF